MLQKIIEGLIFLGPKRVTIENKRTYSILFDSSASAVHFFPHITA